MAFGITVLGLLVLAFVVRAIRRARARQTAHGLASLYFKKLCPDVARPVHLDRQPDRLGPLRAIESPGLAAKRWVEGDVAIAIRTRVDIVFLEHWFGVCAIVRCPCVAPHAESINGHWIAVGSSFARPVGGLSRIAAARPRGGAEASFRVYADRGVESLAGLDDRVLTGIQRAFDLGHRRGLSLIEANRAGLYLVFNGPGRSRLQASDVADICEAFGEDAQGEPTAC